MNMYSRPEHDNTASRSIKPPYPTRHRSPSSAHDFQQPISVQPGILASMQPYSAFSSTPVPACALNLTYQGHSTCHPGYQQTIPYQPICAIPENTLFLMPSMTDNVPPKLYIATLLSRLGIPTKLRGFQYIVQALLYLLNRSNESRCRKTEIYAVIANQNQTSPAAVEHAIRHAIGQMWQGDHIRAYCAMMGRSVSPYELCPSTGDFLSSLLLFLRMQMGWNATKSITFVHVFSSVNSQALCKRTIGCKKENRAGGGINPRPLIAPCVPFDTRHVQYNQSESTHTPGRVQRILRV